MKPFDHTLVPTEKLPDIIKSIYYDFLVDIPSIHLTDPTWNIWHRAFNGFNNYLWAGKDKDGYYTLEWWKK